VLCLQLAVQGAPQRTQPRCYSKGGRECGQRSHGLYLSISACDNILRFRAQISQQSCASAMVNEYHGITHVRCPRRNALARGPGWSV
jgi:hypothetical protein